MRRIPVLRVFAMLFLAACLSISAQPQDQPLVPDSNTAIKLTKVLLSPIYGERFVRGKIFSAEKTDGVWIVIGRPVVKTGKKMTGGVIEVRMNAVDVKVTFLHLQL